MRRLAIAALALILAGCGTTDSTEPGVSLSGRYQLRSINGTSLPYTVSNGLQLTSDVLTLFEDGTYSDDAQFSDGSVVVEDGFYSNNNGAITFSVRSTGAQYSGSLSGSVLTEFVGNLTETYQKL